MLPFCPGPSHISKLANNSVLLIPCIWIALQPQILFQKCSYQDGWTIIGNLIASLVSFLALKKNIRCTISEVGTYEMDQLRWCSQAAIGSNKKAWFHTVWHTVYALANLLQIIIFVKVLMVLQLFNRLMIIAANRITIILFRILLYFQNDKTNKIILLSFRTFSFEHAQVCFPMR